MENPLTPCSPEQCLASTYIDADSHVLAWDNLKIEHYNFIVCF